MAQRYWRGRAVIMPAESPPRFAAGVSAFAEYYDGFVIDQWGVMHDGQTAYPGAIECMQRLATLGKTIIVLTNSGRRAIENSARLAALGFEPERYTAVVSSGEATWMALAQRNNPFYARLGRRCFLVSRGGDKSVVDDLDLELVETVETADFILLGGMDELKPMAFYEHVLAYGSKHQLPMICANPDKVIITAVGLRTGSGEIAHRYESLGGEVRYFGKPHPEIYDYCRKASGVSSDRIVAIGDSLEHDIAGGAAAGFATAFVTGGIFQKDFSSADDNTVHHRRLADLAEKYAVSPEWVIPALQW